MQQFADHAPQRFARLHVQPHGGFVEEHELGAPDQREAELHLPLLAAGQLVVAARGEVAQREALDHRVHVIGKRVVTGDLFQQLAAGHDSRQRHLLHHHADAAAGFDCLRRLVEQLHLALVRVLQPQQQRDGRGFAGAVGSQQGQQFTAMYRQIEAVQRGDGAVALADPGEPGECSWHRSSHAGRMAKARLRLKSPLSVRRSDNCQVGGWTTGVSSRMEVASSLLPTLSAYSARMRRSPAESMVNCDERLRNIS